MTTYDDGRSFAQKCLDAGETRELVATIAGEHAAEAYETPDEIADFGTGVLDVLHDRPHRDAQG